MSFHSVQTVSGNHIIHNFVYANASARTSASLLSTDIGKVALQSDTNSFWILQNNSPLTWSQINGGGSGTGSKDYLTTYTASTSGGSANPGNGDFEVGTSSGWSLAHSALSSLVPSSLASAGNPFSASSGGSAASGNLSLSVVSSAQLAGSYSGSLASSASSVAGDMLISDAFYIDLEDQAKVMTFSFYYEAFAGAANLNFSGTSSNSFAVYIYDVTNAAWIQPAGVYNLVQSSGAGYCTGTFQSSSSSIRYQIALINVNASSGSYTLYVDDFILGPQTAPLGPPVSDWQSYSLTIGSTGSAPSQGTGATKAAYWRRVGDSMEIRFEYLQSAAGSAGSGTYLFPLPSGYSPDSSKANSAGVSGEQDLGSGSGYDGSNTYNGAVFIHDGSNLAISVAGSAAPLIGSSTVALSNTVARISFEALIPILGWSSNTVMSADTDTRVVAARYVDANNYGVVSSTPVIIKYQSLSVDTHAAYSTSTGLFTAPVSGNYRVSAGAYVTGGTAGDTSELLIYKNGAQYSFGSGLAQSANNWSLSVSDILPLSAGDTVSIYIVANSGTIVGVSLNSIGDHLAIERLSGPATVAASEFVSAEYYGPPALSLTTSPQIVKFGTSVYDTHGAYNTSTGVYTCPVSGIYKVASFIQTDASSHSSGIGSHFLIGAQNTTNSSSFSFGKFTYQTTTPMRVNADGEINLVCHAGDQISVYAFIESGVTATLDTSSDSVIMIELLK